MSCAVAGCSNCKRFKPENISFHTFPRNEELTSKWIESLQLDPHKWQWSKNKVVCSKHFDPDDFDAMTERRILKHGAVPRISTVDPLPSFDNTCQISQEYDETDIDPLSSPGAERRLVSFIKTIHSYSEKEDPLLTENLRVNTDSSMVSEENERLKHKIAQLEKRLERFQKIFSPMQLKKLEDPRVCLDWSEEDQGVALYLYTAAPETYEFLLKKGYPWPMVSELKQIKTESD